MNITIQIQLPDAREVDTLGHVIENLATSQAWEQISVAVAYSSLAGVTRLHEAIYAAHPKASFRWLLGLDDYVTFPGAIDFCRSVKNTDVRLYSSKPANTRFHPKVILFDASRVSTKSTIIIGSANLTFAALNRNCEAIAVIGAQNQDERAVMQAKFDALWSLGFSPTEAILSDYEDKFKKFRKARAFLLGGANESKAVDGPILHSDSALVNPGTASVCWIEVGKNTAMGRELEMKGEQARFFGLEPTGGAAAFRNFVVSSGGTVQMRLKYQSSNAMWRLQLRASVPEVALGLRPVVNSKLGRSPYVAIFKRTKTKDLFSLSFPKRNSKEFENVRKQSTQSGTVGRTVAREYGWH